jgi:Tfp pilus assembly protein PilN
MIRVDLGKDEVQKGKGKGLSKLSKLLSGGGKGAGGLGKGINKVTGGARQTIMFGVAFALAFLPHLFFEQARSYLAEQQAQRMKETQDKLGVLEQETEKLLPYQRELESYEAQKKLVRDRIDVVRQLLATRNAPVAVLDTIGQALPKRAWLIKSEMKIDNGNAELVLTGQAFANEDIADFVDALQKSVFISEAVLKTVSKVDENRIELKQFVVTVVPKAKMMIAPPPPAAPAATGTDPAVADGAQPNGRGVAGEGQ